MRALKTIVATAVIVFALTTVAMAGVQHFTKQSGQTTGTQAQQAQPSYSVTLTAAQLKELIGTQGNGARKADAHADRTRQQDKARVRDAVRTTTRDHTAAQTGSTSGSVNSATGTCTPHDYDHDYDWGGSGDGQHRSGDSGEGCR
jgi:Tfp pilus assembly major pilin PilA